MKINIFGSTGIIGRKSLKLIEENFPNLKVNLLCANNNYNLLFKQIEKFKPKYVFINNQKKSIKLKLFLNKNIKILTFDELIEYLLNSVSDYSILAISGYKSLNYLDPIVRNTDNLGIVSKEAIVSAGHIFKKNNYFNKTNIFPLDSEHYSLFEFFKMNNSKNQIKKIILTASGGPFYKKKFNDLKNVTYNEAIKHPKWNMGYKNSIDSATLINKCLEIIEAHYLFDIPYSQIDILIHPEAIVHSIIENKNYTTHMNLFKNDMSIPIINFLMSTRLKNKYNLNNLYYNKYSNLDFLTLENKIFPIYKYFCSLDKNNPANLIKFNLGNEFAVNLFKNKLIKYTDIYKIIKKVGSLNLYYSLNTIKGIINYHEEIEKILPKLFKNYF